VLPALSSTRKQLGQGVRQLVTFRVERALAAQHATANFKSANSAQLDELELSVASRFSQTLYIPNEAQVDNRELLKAVAIALEDKGVECHWKTFVAPDFTKTVSLASTMLGRPHVRTIIVTNFVFLGTDLPTWFGTVRCEICGPRVASNVAESFVQEEDEAEVLMVLKTTSVHVDMWMRLYDLTYKKPRGKYLIRREEIPRPASRRVGLMRELCDESFRGDVAERRS
jgi:hypothetical protein